VSLTSGTYKSEEDRVDLPPRVSVGMPVFNGERFLSETLNCVLDQTFKEFELIISDNGSTDRTEQICRSYAETDPRIRYYRSDTNRGASWNHNRVFELARGEYFKWWSHDDLCAPEFLQECVAVLDKNPEVDLCFAPTQIVDSDRRPVTKYVVQEMTRTDSPRAYQRFHGVICPHHWCFGVYGVARTSVLRQTPLIANYTGSDRALLADLSLRGRFHEISSCRVFNRDHPARSIRVYSAYTAGGWYDPRLKGKISLHNWRRLLEHARSVSRSGLSWWERICCYAQLVPFCFQWRTQLARDIVVAAKTICRRVSLRGDSASRVVHGDEARESERRV
jgi:glycosyltransferase involved in cell wall biosynthesis